jgi:hypothetical protein
MGRSWSLLADHARTRHATVTWDEAAELGISETEIASWCRRGRLVHPAPNVYVVAGSPDSWEQRVRIAVGSSAGWASHRTAGALWRLDGFPRRQVEVVVPYGLRRRRSGWVVHETRTMHAVDLDEVGGIRCTSIARTILDAIAVVHPFVVGLALDHACRRLPGMLDVVVQRHLELPRRGRRGSRIMSEMLDERLGRGRFVDSGFESKAVGVVRSIGLPEPVLQHTVRDGEFVAHLDLAWPPIMWAVECDSLAHHSGKRAHEWDRQRRRRLKQLGWDVVEITYDDVTKRATKTAAELRALYDDRVRRFCQR